MYVEMSQAHNITARTQLYKLAEQLVSERTKALREAISEHVEGIWQESAPPHLVSENISLQVIRSMATELRAILKDGQP